MPSSRSTRTDGALLAVLVLASTACTAAGPISAGPGVDAGAADAPGDDRGDAASPDADLPPVLSAATLSALQELSPATLPPPPADVSNRYADDPAAAALGHQLFFDKGFSGALLDSDNTGDSTTLGKAGQTGMVACAGCHVPSGSFLDNRSARKQVSLAAGWGRRRTRHLLDIGQAKVIMWDGRHDALYNQPFQPIEGAVEMNSSRLFVAEQIYKRYRPAYEAIFGPFPVALDSAPFPQLDATNTGCRRLSGEVNAISTGVDCHGMPGDGEEFDGLPSQDDKDAVTRVVVNMGKALGAFERLLSCGPSRFDQWMHGHPDALTPSEQRGAALFVGQREDGSTIAGCNTCHSGPFLTDQAFHNVGLQPVGVGPAGSFVDTSDHGELEGLTLLLADPLNTKGAFSDGDDGRLPATVPANADGAFRTPSLRCVSRRPSLTHTGQILTLADAVAFFDRGGDSSDFPGTSENFARHFTAQERADLVAFLQALDGTGPDPSLVAQPQLPP